jgi:4-hydroxy-tetrahydrodipicolinate synthase
MRAMSGIPGPLRPNSIFSKHDLLVRYFVDFSAISPFLPWFCSQSRSVAPSHVGLVAQVVASRQQRWITSGTLMTMTDEGASMRLVLNGIFPAHITPFLKNEEIDRESLRVLVDFWLGSGCAGLVTCASNGEAPYLTREERRAVLGLVIDEVNAKAPVIAGVGAPSTRETTALARDAEDAGADALLIVSPYFYKPTNKELFEHYSRAISSIDTPVILYNVPKFTGYNLDSSLMIKIAEEFDQVVGIKDSGGSIGQIADLIDHLSNRVSVLAGTTDVLLPCLYMGGKGAILAVANVVPQLCVDLYVNFKKGETERARQLQMKLLRLNDVLVKKFNQISAIKEAMNQLGKPAGYPRGPSLPIEGNASDEIRRELSALGIAQN